MSKINENIRKFRELRRLTQKQFAEQLSKSRNVISNWERGENSPDPDTLEQICKILKVTPNMIYGWDPCPDYERYQSRLKDYVHRINRLAEEKERIDFALAEARRQMDEVVFAEDDDEESKEE